MEEGKGDRKSDKTSGTDCARKSEEIATTPAREPKGKGTVTPSDQPLNEREQQSSKKKREEQKRTMNHYFWGGDKVSRHPKGGLQYNQFFSDAMQRHRNAQRTQTTLSNLSSLLNGSIM